MPREDDDAEEKTLPHKRRPDRDDDDDDDTLPKRAKKKAFPGLPVVLGVLAAVILLCGGGGIFAFVKVREAARRMRAENDAKEGQLAQTQGQNSTPDKVQAGPVIKLEYGVTKRIGDVEVTVIRALNDKFASEDANGDFIYHGKKLVVSLDYYNPTDRKVRIGSQEKRATAVDSKRERLEHIFVQDQFGRPSRIVNGQIMIGETAEIQPGTSKQDTLVFAEATNTATSALLTLDATQFGGQGTVEINLVFEVTQYSPKNFPPKRK